MIEFIFANIVFISLGVILYLFVKTLPRIGEEDSSRSSGIVERWVTSDIPERMDVIFNSFLFKALKRMRVFVLRADHTLDRQLRNIKKYEDDKESGKDGNEDGVDFLGRNEKNELGD